MTPESGTGAQPVDPRATNGAALTDDQRRVQALQRAKRDAEDGFDSAIVALKGSFEFRHAVEHLLTGTPFAKPDGDDYEGLYGRLRSALQAVRPPVPDPQTTVPSQQQENEQGAARMDRRSTEPTTSRTAPTNEADRIEQAYRRELWINHGHPIAALYGDDGEIQCHLCRVDYKRAPLPHVEEVATKERWTRMSKVWDDQATYRHVVGCGARLHLDERRCTCGGTKAQSPAAGRSSSAGEHPVVTSAGDPVLARLHALLMALSEKWRAKADEAERSKEDAAAAKHKPGEDINRAKMLTFRECAAALDAARASLVGLETEHDDQPRMDRQP